VPWLLDPNRAILLLVELSCALVLVRVARRWRRLRRERELVDAAVTAGLVGVVGWLVYRTWPHGAGYVSGGLWVGLLVGPALLVRAANRCVMRRRLGAANALVRVAACLRPLAGWGVMADFYAGLAWYARGDRDRGLRLWQKLERSEDAFAGVVAVERLAAEGNWAEIRSRIEALTDGGVAVSPSLLPRYIRALGEVGSVDAMLDALARHGSMLAANPALSGQCLLPAFAFTGRVERLAELLSGPFAVLDSTSRRAWLGTAEFAAGREGQGRAHLTGALRKADHLQRRAIERRLAEPPAVAENRLSAEARGVLGTLEREWMAARRVLPACLPRRTTWLTWLLAISLVGVFLVEATRGGSTRTDTLLGMGALDPDLVLAGQWWRVLAAQWLHYGPVHLGLNLVGLGLLGWRVERALGMLRTAIVYLTAGTLGMIGHTLLFRAGLVPHTLLVGASGGVMGLAGAAGAILLGGWRNAGLVAARTELRFILLLVVAQAIADLSLPGISFLGHALGATAGFGLAGLLVRLGWRLWVGVTLPALVVSIGGEAGAAHLPWRRAPCRGGDVAECAASCELGVLESCAILGHKYTVGEDVRRDLVRARTFLERACRGGLSEACTHLGLTYEEDAGLPDPGRALSLFETACQGGSAYGCRKLGIALWHGRGTPSDREQALILFMRACQAGDQRSCEFAEGTREP
jgi:rhomboid protease GluP